LTLHGKGGERKLENMVENLWIVKSNFFMNHHLLIKKLKKTNLKRKIMEMKRLQVWKTCCGLKNVSTMCIPTQKFYTSLGERGQGKEGGNSYIAEGFLSHGKHEGL
jgi:hypothetical protein